MSRFRSFLCSTILNFIRRSSERVDLAHYFFSFLRSAITCSMPSHWQQSLRWEDRSELSGKWTWHVLLRCPPGCVRWSEARLIGGDRGSQSVAPCNEAAFFAFDCTSMVPFRSQVSVWITVISKMTQRRDEGPLHQQVAYIEGTNNVR